LGARDWEVWWSQVRMNWREEVKVGIGDVGGEEDEEEDEAYLRRRASARPRWY
jgi:hypothetical protein